MNVGFFRTDFYGHINVGGSFTHTRGFLDGLHKLGHNYFVVSSGDLPLETNAHFYKVPYSSLYRNLPEILSIAYNRTLVRKATEILAQEHPDFIYHRHSEFNYSTAFLARKFNIPLVLECNGSEVWIKKNWGRIYFERILKQAEEIQFLTANIITVVSNVMKDDLIRLGVDGRKILVNPNGVDPDLFHPDTDGSEIVARFNLQGKIICGFVGTFGAWHGVEVLARAVKPTIQRNPYIHFLIIGEGTLRGEIERILRSDGVEEFVTLTGSVPHTEIPKHLGACEILLSPHVQNTDGTVFFGSPTKLFEYLGMGKAIVASSVGQIGEIMIDGQNCLLMKHRDHEDLAEKILYLVEHPDLRVKLGATARKNAIEMFSWQRNAQNVINAVQPFLRQ